MTSTHPRPTYHNDQAGARRATASTPQHAARAFHQKLPNYSPTPLISLNRVAADIDVQAVYLKDEGQRLGLPSFKILGASWATFRAVTQKLGLPLQSELAAVQEALKSSRQPLVLLAATDGNHGRAVARMGSILGLQVEVFVPRGVDEVTAGKIRDEGATVTVTVTQTDGSYDQAVRRAFDEAEALDGGRGLLVQDTAFQGYEEIPNWIVEGYGSMMLEIDEQLGDRKPNLMVVPVGVGSLAQAVVIHAKGPGKDTKVLAVEADTAACLYESLIRKEPMTLENTEPTIMAGLDCGTVSTIAWPVLLAGVDASLSISDVEAHRALGALHSMGVLAGPCGASPLAALHRLKKTDKAALGLDESSVVILLCTEGPREYIVPNSVVTNLHL